MRWIPLTLLLAPMSPSWGQTMTLLEVNTALAQAVQEAQVASPDDDRIIAVVDREGHALAVWSIDGAPATPSDVELSAAVGAAVSKASTAAFLSSDQHAFTTRTASFIIRKHFPPAVSNRPNGPLVGVGFSSMAFSDTNKSKAPTVAGTFPPPPVPGVNPAQDLASATPADVFRSVPYTSLAAEPGGVPLFRSGKLIGGVGVVGFGDAAVTGFDITLQANVNEHIALSGQAGFRPAAIFAGRNVLIDGVRLAYQVGNGSNATVPLPAVYLSNPANGTAVMLTNIDGIAGSSDDGVVDYSPKASPAPVTYPNPFGLVGKGGTPGQLRSAVRADPTAGLIAGVPRLTAAEVESILSLAADRSAITRAGIRLPRGQVARVWISVVNNPAVDGEEPVVLGTYRTPDATIFSWDVAIQKARTAVFFSRGLERGTPRAFSCRSVGFLSQETYPPGIGSSSGPLQNLQGLLSVTDFGAPLGFQVPLDPINLNVPNGITIFPGGFPLYRDGVLIGAIGVSGDGIEQDDIVGAAGTRDFAPPNGARADGMVYQRARIPYAKFPRAASSF